MTLVFIFTPRPDPVNDALEIIFNDLDERRIANLAEHYPQSIFFYADLMPTTMEL